MAHHIMRPLNRWIEDEDKGFFIRGSYDPETAEGEPVGKFQLFDHEREIFEHAFTPDLEGQFPYTTYILSAPKKSGKTTWAAMIGEWFAEESVPHTEIYVMAADHEAAQDRIFDDIAFHVKEANAQPDREKIARPMKSEIQYPDGTVIKAMANDAYSAAGSRHALTLWDELWTFRSEKDRLMWAELTPISIPGVPVSMQVITTYAGIEGESNLLYDLYSKVVRGPRGQIVGTPVPELEHIRDKRGDPVCFSKGRIFAYWDTVGRFPWQNKAYYDLQMETLRPNEFRRYHFNEWTSSDEDFIPIEWWDRAAEAYERPPLSEPNHEYKSWPLVIGYDIGWKKDKSAIAVVAYDAGEDRMILMYHKIWEPREDALFNMIDAVELELQQLFEKYNVVAAVGDPTQFHGAIKRLQAAGYPIEEMSQSSAKLMTAVGQNLYDYFKLKKFDAYPDDEARDHIKYCSAVNKGQGFRMVKKDGSHPNDFAIALAMAAYQAINMGGTDTSEPLRIEMPFSDVSEWKYKSAEEELEEKMLPFPLRS